MTIINRLKRAFTAGSDLNEKWSIPESTRDLEQLFNAESGLQLIYKHSDACMTCMFTKKRIEELMNNNQHIQSFHYIEVRLNRELSNFVSDKTGIKHESPQAILLHNGEVIWHASHSAIELESIQNALTGII